MTSVTVRTFADALKPDILRTGKMSKEKDLKQRRNHYDVTNRVRVSHPQDVAKEAARLLCGVHPDFDRRTLLHAFDTFARLYAGLLPGYVGCDTWYHDAQHSLDCALAMARLLDGHERGVPVADRLGARHALLGMMIALFHDSGYIRRDRDSALNGAEYTLCHVQRSSEFLRKFLAETGFEAEAPLAARIVHFTGYEIALDQIDVQDPRDRLLGFLVGTADLLAQTSDRCYPEKCRDFLFPEFEICGLAGPDVKDGTRPVYRNREELLTSTQQFNNKLWNERLDGYFGGVHRYLGVHFSGRFGGRNPYIDSIRANLSRVARAVRDGRQQHVLSNRPEAIDAIRLREILGLSPSVARIAA